jgi:hypothetical protein
MAESENKRVLFIFTMIVPNANKKNLLNLDPAPLSDASTKASLPTAAPPSLPRSPHVQQLDHNDESGLQKWKSEP